MKEPNQARLILAALPEEWPTLDEFPETDVSDLMRKFEDAKEDAITE